VGFFDRVKRVFLKSDNRQAVKPESTKKRSRRLGRRLGHKKTKNYNKKVGFTLRVERGLIADFRALCEERGVYVNEVLELYMRQVLDKKAKEKIFKRLVRGRT